MSVLIYYVLDKNDRVLDWDKNRENVETFVHEVRDIPSLRPVRIVKAPEGQYSGCTFDSSRME